MTNSRQIVQTHLSTPTLEGAGVHLRRAFGFHDTHLFDPFLLFDDFRADLPEHYLKGFPWHPHRGIETITYVLKGDVEHGDSLGNRGTISSGDVQWMTAGSGIIHQEMPKGDAQGAMHGFQLWLNLPAAEKMQHPRYRDIGAATIPTLHTKDGVAIKVISGRIGDLEGPVSGISTDPTYLDISIPALVSTTIPTPLDYTALAYVIAGSGSLAPDFDQVLGDHSLVLFGKGDQICTAAGAEGLRFLLMIGKPLAEPIAWQGPIVMNSQQELQQAFLEYRQGTFLRHK